MTPPDTRTPAVATDDGVVNWQLVHAVRAGALNALRHCNVDEELFAAVASATYAPIRTAISAMAHQP